LHPQDAEAVGIVRLIDELFALDAEARTAKLDHAARHVLRSKKAPALLAEIKAAVTAARATSLLASALAKAANYTLALWPKLPRFLEYPELELSNNLAENSMRPVELAKTGSTSAANKPDPKSPPSSRSSKPADG
jgi:transposase